MPFAVLAACCNKSWPSMAGLPPWSRFSIVWLRGIPVPSAQILPSGTASCASTLTSLTASTSLTSSSNSALSFSCFGVPSIGGKRAESSCSRRRVAADMLGFGYEDKRSCTDQVGFRGMPQESVSGSGTNFEKEARPEEIWGADARRRAKSRHRRVRDIENVAEFQAGLRKTTMTLANYGRISQVLRGLLPPNPPPTIAQRTGNLYEVLSRAPGGGVGKHVYQTRWRSKTISNCYWEITRSKFKCEGKHGKAWGKMYWKGGYSCFLIYCPRQLNPLYPRKTSQRKGRESARRIKI
jgi:small subunit ribosomal protein S34